MTVIAKEDFSGIKRVIPGVYGKFESANTPVEGLDLNTLILIGQADNAPYYGDTAKEFSERYITVSSFADAKKIMKGGELLEAVNIASSPAKDTDKPSFAFSRGPKLYKLININPNIASTLSVLSTSGGTHTIEYGVAGNYGNKVRMRKILADKKIQVATPDGITESPSLDKKAFNITYIGDATTAILTIDATGITVTLAGDQTDGSLDLSVPVSEFSRIGDAIDFINSQSGYVATLLDIPDFKVEDLDHVEAAEAIDIKTIYTAKADLYTEIQFFEGTGLGEFTTIAAVRKPIADMPVYQFFSGGAIGTPAADDMKNAIDFASSLSGMFRNILSSSTSDHLYFKTVVARMISAGNETLGGCGGALPASENLATRQLNARAIGGYLKYGISPFYHFDLNGTKKLYPGYMLAVLDNAISASVSPRLSATHKSLWNVIGTNEVLNPSDVEQCINAGGLVITQKNQNSPWWIERSVTTEVAMNSIKSDSATYAGALTCIKIIRERLEPLVGLSTVDKSARVQGVTEQDMVLQFEGGLAYLVEQGFLVGSDLLGIKPYDQNFKIRIDGDAWYVEMKGRSFSVINFVFFMLGLEELKGTV